MLHHQPFWFWLTYFANFLQLLQFYNHGWIRQTIKLMFIQIWYSLFFRRVWQLLCFHVNQPLSFNRTSTDPCNSNPCVNGQCHSDSNNEGWSCDCLNGWVGQRCDFREGEYQSTVYLCDPVQQMVACKPLLHVPGFVLIPSSIYSSLFQVRGILPDFI